MLDWNSNLENQYGKKYLLQNVEIYIGEDLNWRNNPKCPGGPFLNFDATSAEYGYRYDPFKNVNIWKHGKEAWCNMQGQYTTIVATFTEEIDYPPALCTVGIFGTNYVRDDAFLGSITVVSGTQQSLQVPHVYADPQIGNILAINLR